MPGYDDEGDLMPYHGKASRAATTKMPWWNPRYWARKVWIAVVAVLVIVIVIAVAVGVTVSKKDNAYPSYNALSYTLQDTCKFYLHHVRLIRRTNTRTDSGENFFDQFNYFHDYDPGTS